MKVKKAIIPAAGRGMRMKKVDSNLPKELLKIGKKPMIDYVLNELENTSIEDVFIIISKQKDILKNHLKRKKYHFNLNFIYQPKPYGLAEAILRAKDYIKDESFLISLPDNLSLGRVNVSSKIISSFERYKKNLISCIKISRKRAYQFSNAGNIDYENYENTKDMIKITKFHPKRKGPFRITNSSYKIRTFARYIFMPYLFDYIKMIKDKTDLRKKELDDVPVIQEMLKSKIILGLIVDNKGIFDCGNIEGYSACCEFVKRKML